MAEVIAFDIATELITKLSSRALSQVGLYWNLKHDIDHITRTVRTIKAVLLDAEEKSVTDNLVKVWLEELKDVLYDADDLLDDFSTEALRKDLMGGNKLTKEVQVHCCFWMSRCSSMTIARHIAFENLLFHFTQSLLRA
ncbi:hypothetical protein E1A91_A11G354900v1 [Gossypium mustelinum]|uniref:Disease resistance N-terminal domain-containing protein n=1 Tax=Gossypium mustelinum TaxID=34275 RepID=A0A5D2XET9_GOSMU|nr:hypothetical protein E1A91_A11G354900v1 [Gossypium mustelinum]